MTLKRNYNSIEGCLPSIRGRLLSKVIFHWCFLTKDMTILNIFMTVQNISVIILKPFFNHPETDEHLVHSDDHQLTILTILTIQITIMVTILAILITMVTIQDGTRPRNVIYFVWVSKIAKCEFVCLFVCLWFSKSLSCLRS